MIIGDKPLGNNIIPTPNINWDLSLLPPSHLVLISSLQTAEYDNVGLRRLAGYILHTTHDKIEENIEDQENLLGS